jgi:16S rRNA G966 N2-methylase RsmD
LWLSKEKGIVEPTMKISISKIKPNPDNPRIIKDDKFKKLVQSLKDFPEMTEVRPIVVNKEMMILGGNMRLKAMQEAEWKDVPVTVVDWPAEKQKEFIIKDNANFGEWNWDTLANEWDEIKLEEWGLDVLFTKDIQEDEIPDIPEKTDIKLGDIITIGNHRIICGDACNPDLYQDYDLCFTDPPFDFDVDLLKKTFRIVEQKVNGNIFFLGSDKQLATLIKESKSKFVQFSYWKSTLAKAGYNYFYQDCNTIIHFTTGKINWINAHKGYRKLIDFSNNEYWLGEDSKKKKDSKPIKLPFKYLESFKCEKIIDPFGGYGSTLLAAHQLDKHCTIIEISPYLCQLIINRLQNFDNSLKINILSHGSNI